MRWPWQRDKRPSEATERLRQRLREVERDDVMINRQTERTKKIIHDNHLATDIQRALGVRK